MPLLLLLGHTYADSSINTIYNGSEAGTEIS